MRKLFLAVIPVIALLASPAGAMLTGSNLTFSTLPPASPTTGDSDTHFVSQSASVNDGPSFAGTRNFHWTLTQNDPGYTYTNISLIVDYVYMKIANSDPLALTYQGPVNFDYGTQRPNGSASTLAGKFSGTLVGGDYAGHTLSTFVWSASTSMYFDTIDPTIPGISPNFTFSPFTSITAPSVDYTKLYPIIPVLASLAPATPTVLQNSILEYITLDTTDSDPNNWVRFDQLSGQSSNTFQREYVGTVVPEPSSVIALASFVGLFGLRIKRSK